MIDEVSSIFWGLSLAVNIILLLVGLPLCLLICCCCKKHQGAIERDIKDIARNHNILQQDTQPVQNQQNFLLPPTNQPESNHSQQQQQYPKRRGPLVTDFPPAQPSFSDVDQELEE